jgi:exosome complex component RRP45
MELSLNEHDFIRKALKDGVRLDKRGFTEFRPLNIELGKREGQVLVRLGDTKVYCMVSADVVVPPIDRPLEGQLQIFVEIFPGSHPPETSANDLEACRLSLQRLLDRSIKMSRAVDTESLCILPGQRVWSVRVDVHVLDDDGCAGDAALISAVSALQAFKRPAVEVVDGAVKVFSTFDRHPVPLIVMHCPVPITFAFLGNTVSDSDFVEDENAIMAPTIVADPTAMEEKALDGCMTIVMNRQGELVAAIKAGGLPLSPDCIAGDCMTIARQRTGTVYDSIISALKK